MCIFAAELFSLSVKSFTARDGIVMFSHYFKQFCILVQIATTSPDMLQNRSQKSPILPKSPFFPLLQHISAQSPDGKILYRSTGHGMARAEEKNQNCHIHFGRRNHETLVMCY